MFQGDKHDYISQVHSKTDKTDYERFYYKLDHISFVSTNLLLKSGQPGERYTWLSLLVSAYESLHRNRF